MKITFWKNKLKVAALVICAAVTAGSVTYVNNDKPVITAKTINDLEAEKAQNNEEISSIEQELNALKQDAAEHEAYQAKLQEKIDLQNENIDNVNTIINELSSKIDEKELKIEQLEDDIVQKQADIDEGLEQFKGRLRAMYVSGNDSMASALIGATDFYDMLTKMELISQVAKYDDALIESLQTQLKQFEEAQQQLDIEKTALATDLATQEANMEELRVAMQALQDDYEKSADYLERVEADMASKQRSIEELEADNAAMDEEIDAINAEIKRQQEEAKKQQQAAQQQQQQQSSNNNSSSGNSGDGQISGSTGSGSFNGSLSWPVPGFYGVSSHYGYRWGTLHAGMDIAGGGINGATVTACDGGRVIIVKSGCGHNYPKNGSCGCGGGYGNYVVVDHGNGVSTLYGHMTSVNVSVGQSVSRGSALGTVGSTGYSTGYHLHLEVRVNGSTVNPANYLY